MADRQDDARARAQREAEHAKNHAERLKDFAAKDAKKPARVVDSVKEAQAVHAGEGPSTPVIVKGNDDGHVLPEGQDLVGTGVVVGPLSAKGGNRIAGHTYTSGIGIDGDGVLLERATFRGGKDAGIMLTVAGRNAEVRFCLFERVLGRGISVIADTKRPAAGAHIHHNQFRDWLGVGQHGHEGVQLGQTGADTKTRLGATVEFNLFERVAVDSEDISLKSSGNKVRFNTLVASKNIMNRHGEDNDILANWLEASGNIVLFDKGGLCLWNRAGVRYMAGSVTKAQWDQHPGQSPVTHDSEYPQSVGWVIYGNSGVVAPGAWDRCTVKPEGIILPSPGSRPDLGAPLVPVRLTPTQVGPGA